MKAFITGATGFLGSRVAGSLRVRGDDVVALVRSPGKAKPLADIGCQLVEGDLGDRDVIEQAMSGCDAVFHIAAVYEVGISESRRPAMHEANVVGTETVLDAAVKADVERIVYVSTVGVFGNTARQIVDESYERSRFDFLSYYEETKYLAHQIAKDRIDRGAPIVIVQPSLIYGPNDHTQVGAFLGQALRGKLHYIPFATTGFAFVHVDDVARGIVLAHDKGRIGESYVLGGESTTVKDALSRAALAGGHRPPKVVLPNALMKLMVPVSPLFGKVLGLPPNLREVNGASFDVTYWARSDKAKDELGYTARDLDSGLRDMQV